MIWTQVAGLRQITAVLVTALGLAVALVVLSSEAFAAHPIQSVPPFMTDSCTKTPSIQRKSDVAGKGLLVRMSKAPDPVFKAAIAVRVAKPEWWRGRFFVPVSVLVRGKSTLKQLGLTGATYLTPVEAREHPQLLKRELQGAYWQFNPDFSAEFNGRVKLGAKYRNKLAKARGTLKVLTVCHSIVKASSGVDYHTVEPSSQEMHIKLV